MATVIHAQTCVGVWCAFGAPVCAYRCGHFSENKGCYCQRAGPLGDLCHAFPEKPSCSRSVTIAHGCFLRDMLSWPSG